jgi:dolichol-phosphate mannosyltransferase
MTVQPPSAPRLFILIPVYNEAGNISRLLQSLKVFSLDIKDDYCVEVVLIDDGSQDETAHLARKSTVGLNMVVLRHEQNQGPGRAFATGFRYLSEKFSDGDRVVTMEGDNTSRLELIRQMLHRMDEGFDVILASPYIYSGRIVHTSPFRVFLSSMANLFVKELIGIHGIFTVSSFYRLYKVPLLKRLQQYYGAEIIERRGFECMTEMLMKMIYLDTSISEVAMVLDTKLRAGKSKMKISRTILGYYALWAFQSKWKRMAIAVGEAAP